VADLVPVLLDTDIGSDIDDAVALAYLLQQPRCDLVGITTVTGDTAKRAALAAFLCDAAGKPDIPIHRGAENVLLYGPGQPDVPQYAAIADRRSAMHWPAGTAVRFMLDVVRSRPGEVTLLSIGPLTNVALLFALDPEVPGLLGSFVSMAGSFSGAYPKSRDWNSVCDPLATAVAFRAGAGAPRRRHVGLDVTMPCRLGAGEVRQRFRGPVLEAVLDVAGAWFAERDHIIFHDPLAALSVFEPEVCSYTRGRVAVDDRGYTYFTADPLGPEEVAVSVEPERFFAAYFSVFQPPAR
jgi:purine nucleosidase